jgi:hypothetical protein
MSYTDAAADGRILGDLRGIRSRTFFPDRQESHEKKLHRGLRVGIASHGSSIVLSSGNVDDEDLGNVILNLVKKKVYTWNQSESLKELAAPYRVKEIKGKHGKAMSTGRKIASTEKLI